MAIAEVLPRTGNERDIESQPQETTPRAVPTSAQPVFLQLVPFGEYDPYQHSNLFVASGYSAYEDPEIHRLSKIVLQLALTNFALSFLLELIVLVAAVFRKNYLSFIKFIFWVSFAYYVMWLGVRGVKTRNESCSYCEKDCGYLDAFRSIYVLLAVLRAIMLLISIIILDPTDLIFNFLLLVLLSTTADYARRLLDVIHRHEALHAAIGLASGLATSSPPDSIQGGVAPAAQATADTVPMAAARPIEEIEMTRNDIHQVDIQSQPQQVRTGE